MTRTASAAQLQLVACLWLAFALWLRLAVAWQRRATWRQEHPLAESATWAARERIKPGRGYWG